MYIISGKILRPHSRLLYWPHMLRLKCARPPLALEFKLGLHSHLGMVGARVGNLLVLMLMEAGERFLDIVIFSAQMQYEDTQLDLLS